MKHAYCAKYATGYTKDEGAENDEAEDDTEDDDIEDDKDNHADIKGTMLSMEASLDSVIPSQSESETWEL